MPIKFGLNSISLIRMEVDPFCNVMISLYPTKSRGQILIQFYISKICCTFTILTLSWDKKNPVCHHTWVQLWNGECPLNEFTRLSTTLTHPTHIMLGRGPQHIVAPCFLKKTLQNLYTNQWSCQLSISS